MLNPLISTADYIAGREALLIRIDMSAYLIDYYLHRKAVAPEITPAQDEKLKDLIACFAIHLAVHSPIQSHAWTLHTIAEPPYSLFVTGAVNVVDQQTYTATGYLVGNVLTDNIRHTDVNSLHAQFNDSEGRSFRSYVQSESADVAALVEHFYRQSEQQPLRISISRTSDSALGLAALPNYDAEWFEAVDLDALQNDESIPRKRMRTGSLVFACDCSPEKLLPFFRSISAESMEELYGSDEEITIVCPRCGKQFGIHRSQLKPDAQ